LGGGITSAVVRICSGSRRRTEPRGRGGAKLARVSELACVITCFIFFKTHRIRQQPSLAYVRIRQHSSAPVTSRRGDACRKEYVYERMRMSRIRQHTLVYVSIRLHTSAYSTCDVKTRRSLPPSATTRFHTLTNISLLSSFVAWASCKLRSY